MILSITLVIKYFLVIGKNKQVKVLEIYNNWTYIKNNLLFLPPYIKTHIIKFHQSKIKRQTYLIKYKIKC